MEERFLSSFSLSSLYVEPMILMRKLCAAFATCLICLNGAQAEPPGKDNTLQLSKELSVIQLPDAAKDEAKLRLTKPEGVDIRDDAAPAPTIDLTVPPDDLWQRLRNGFAMPDLHSPLVAERQAWYLNHPAALRLALERSRRYLYHIVDELEKRGMPTELALLPIVESSFNPLAYSRARALGMWQFIPSTGKNYKLKQDWWLDQRRDIIASTNAALDYLQYIYEMHGDWHLALASYNWGEGAVTRAIAKNRARGLPTDYASLSMPGETRYYVPKLQALKNIIAQPDLFNFKLEGIPNRPYFGTVQHPGEMDVSLAAKLAGIPVTEFIALNPAYQRPVMPGSTSSPLVLPVERVGTFVANLEQYEAENKPLSTWKTYALKKGEKIDSVAAHNDISASELRKINGITARTKLKPGLVLLIPSQASASLDAKLPQQPSEASGKSKCGKRDKACKKASRKGGKSKAGGKKKSGGAAAKGKKSTAGKSTKKKKR